MSNDDLSINTSSSSYDESIVNSIIFPDESGISYKTVLYEELRLIERNESEINVCWKGAHMMLFFMSFVFGSLCTCCIHRLKFMFGDECVLFPKIVTHSTVHRMVYEFFSFKTDKQDIEPELPVEFVATKWSENSVCYLPTYVPLVSGLSGLVWTTMFLMCSSGTTHNVTGAQRHWRALPIMFVFCAIMATLCIYTSTITHKGLKDLCSKLAHVTGSQKCGYNINVATLAYDRRIRGVYQATLLSIASAWLHTICWLLSTLLIVARVLLAVDFTLVHVTAHLIGNVEDILQRYEKQINSLNAESAKPYKSDIDEEDSEEELYTTTNAANETQTQGLLPTGSRINELKGQHPQRYDSVISLVPEMKQRLIENDIRELLYKLINNIGKPNRSNSIPYGEPTISANTENIKKIAKDITQKFNEKVTQEFNDFEHQININLQNSNINRDTETTSNLKEIDDKKNHRKITDKLEHKKIEQEKRSGLPKERDNNDKDILMKRSHNVQFYDEDLTEETRKRQGKKDEEYKRDKSEDIDKSHKSDELRISDDLNDGDIPAPENTITTKGQKQGENKYKENKQYKSEDKDIRSKISELRIFDYSTDEDKSAPETKIFTKDQKQDDKEGEENEQTKADDKANLVEMVSYIISIIQKIINSSVPEYEKTNKDQSQDDKNDEENEQNKSDDKKDKENKQYKSEDKDILSRRGELRIFDYSNDGDKSKSSQVKDQKQDDKEGEENAQTKADDKANLVEVVSYIISIIQKIINSSVPQYEKTNTDQNQDNKNEENEQNKSEDKEEPGISGELHILDDSNDSRSVSQNEKTNKDQKQRDTK